MKQSQESIRLQRLILTQILCQTEKNIHIIIKSKTKQKFNHQTLWHITWRKWYEGGACCIRVPQWWEWQGRWREWQQGWEGKARLHALSTRRTEQWVFQALYKGQKFKFGKIKMKQGTAVNKHMGSKCPAKGWDKPQQHHRSPLNH